MGGLLSTQTLKYSYPSGPTHDLIVATLRTASFMRHLDDHLLNDLAHCFQVVTVAKGAKIQNDGRSFYIIAEGGVDVSYITEPAEAARKVTKVTDCKTTRLGQRKPGHFIACAVREQLVKRFADDGSNVTSKQKASNRPSMEAMLDRNLFTADVTTGCTLLKLVKPELSKLRNQAMAHKPNTKHTARFSDPRSRDAHGRTMTTAEKIHYLHSIIEADFVIYLADIPFLANVDVSILEALCNLCTYRFISRDELLYERGAREECFYVCVRGSLQASVPFERMASSSSFVSKKDDGSSSDQAASSSSSTKTFSALSRLSSGSFFGEITLLYDLPRVATVTALSDSLLLSFDRSTFEMVGALSPGIRIAIQEHIRLQQIGSVVRQGSTFLGAVSSYKLRELSIISKLVEWMSGTYVMWSGAPTHDFYLLLTGEVEIEYGTTVEKLPSEVGDKKTNGTADYVKDGVIKVYPGGYFGQEAILLDTLSLITVKATKDCLALQLSQDLFHEFFSDLPQLYAEFCIKCLRESCSVEHVLMHYEACRLWSADCLARRCKYNEVELFRAIESFSHSLERRCDEQNHEIALMIYFKFLAVEAPMPVSISKKTVQSIENDVREDSVQMDTFNDARKEILAALDDHAFATFKTSGIFQHLLDTLHCPRAICESLSQEQVSRLSMNRLQVHRYNTGYAEVDRKRTFGSASRSCFRESEIQGGFATALALEESGLNRRNIEGRSFSRQLSASFVFY